MKLLISADMEGISGVVLGDHTFEGHAEFGRFRKLMTADVNAAIEGALAAGVNEIVVNDSHATMTNILIEELNPAAQLISGAPKPFEMMQGIGPDVDIAFSVGYHASSGSGAAILEHTWSEKVFSLQLNDYSVGELGINAALAGAHGVPVVLVTGDQTVAAEARALLGELETVIVKQAITRTAARCLHPEIARDHIRQAAERAALLNTAPLVISPPITALITFQRALHADQAEMIPGSRRVDGRAVEWTGDDMPAVYRAFRAMVALAGA